MAKKKVEKILVKVRFINRNSDKYGEEISYPKAVADKLKKAGKVEFVK